MALTIQTIPGETWPDGSVITLAKLRNTAKPSISLTGTLGTADIADGSVTPAKVATQALAYALDSAGTDAITVTITPAPPSLVDGLLIRFKATSDKTGAATLNVNGLGAKALVKHNGTALATGDIRANQLVEVVYNSSLASGAGAWVLIGPVGNAANMYAADAGSTGDYAITLDPALMGYVTGMTVRFKANTANSGAATLNVNGLGAKVIKKAVNKDLAAGDIGAGALVEVAYDGTNFQLQSQVPTSDTAVRGQALNLTVKNNSVTPNSQVDLVADEVVLRNGGGAAFLATGLSVTIDITAAGANGLDTGTEASSTWYYVWAISDGTNHRGLLSTSSTAPTLPGAYTYAALVGAVRNDGSGNFVKFAQVGNRVTCAEQVVFSAKAAGSADTWETLAGADLTAWQAAVPGTAKGFVGTAGCVPNQWPMMAVASDAAGVGAQYVMSTGTAATWGSWGGASPVVLTLKAPGANIYWKSYDTVARNRLTVSGYWF